MGLTLEAMFTIHYKNILPGSCYPPYHMLCHTVLYIYGHAFLSKYYCYDYILHISDISDCRICFIHFVLFILKMYPYTSCFGDQQFFEIKLVIDCRISPHKLNGISYQKTEKSIYNCDFFFKNRAKTTHFLSKSLIFN